MQATPQICNSCLTKFKSIWNNHNLWTSFTGVKSATVKNKNTGKGKSGTVKQNKAQAKTPEMNKLSSDNNKQPQSEVVLKEVCLVF